MSDQGKKDDDNVIYLDSGKYQEEPTSESVLDEEWISTLDPRKHRILPEDSRP